MNPSAERYILEYASKNQAYPTPQQVAQECFISAQESTDWLNSIINRPEARGQESMTQTEYPVTPRRRTKRKPRKVNNSVSLMDRAILSFTSVIQYVSFAIVTVADFFIECLFYSTFAPNFYSKIALGSWGFVIVGAKLYAWAYNKKALAIFCASLSVIGATGIFNASMEAQAQGAASDNAISITVEDPRISINNQIKAIQDNIVKMTTDRDNLATGENPRAVIDLNKSIAEANDKLPALRKELSEAGVTTQKTSISLEAWQIFKQISSKIGMDDKLFAFIFIFCVSVMIQFIIGSITPRKINIIMTNKEEDEK